MSVVERLTGLPRRDQPQVFLVGLGHAATHWIAATFYILLPALTDAFGLSYAQAGVLVAVFHASSVAANAVSGPLVDLSGRRALLQVLSVAIGAFALMAVGLLGSFWWLALMVVVIGATNNLWHPAAITYLSGRFPATRGYALSIHALGANAGDAAAPIAAGLLLAATGWSATASLNALPALAVAALLALLVLPHDRLHQAGHVSAGIAAYLGQLLQGLRDRAVLGLCLMAGFRTMTQTGLLMFLPLYLSDVMGAGPVAMGLSLSAMQLAGIVAAPVAGTLSDRIGRRPVVLGGLGVATLMIALLTFLATQLVFVAGVALLGFALFAIRPVVHSWLMDLTPPTMGGAATSLMFGIQGLFSVLVPVLGGMLADRWGLPSVFYLLAATMFVANLLAFLLPRGPAASAGYAHQ